MNNENPEEKKHASPEEVLENGEKLNCPCLGDQHKEERPRTRTPWLNIEP